MARTEADVQAAMAAMAAMGRSFRDWHKAYTGRELTDDEPVTVAHREANGHHSLEFIETAALKSIETPHPKTPVEYIRATEGIEMNWDPELRAAIMKDEDGE